MKLFAVKLRISKQINILFFYFFFFFFLGREEGSTAKSWFILKVQ